MSVKIDFSVEVFSRHWGHDNTYSFELRSSEMKIIGVQKSALCSKQEGGDCAWTGYNDSSGNPLVMVLENDRIYPPSVFVRAMESAWEAWLDGRLDDTQVQEEMRLLFEWLNTVSKSRPSSKFWISIF